MTTVVIVQARSSSSRLPAKIFLPVRGIPLAVLAARRAANTGLEVIVATSHDESDDAFAALLKSEGLTCHRGSLEDSLERFVNALVDYDDDTLVVRLTADNIIPDGALIDEMKEQFLSNNLDYLCSTGDESGLPYGVSAELTWLRYLREAHEKAQDLSDREHVTPYVIRKYGRRVFGKYEDLGKSQYRCTVDRLDDYLAILKLFDDVPDPVSEPFLRLIEKMEDMNTMRVGGKLSSPLVIGGAQLGPKYGIANKHGQPSYVEAERLIKTGLENGISIIDTASAYGDSEISIGKALRRDWGAGINVITKLSDLAECPADASAMVVNAFVEASIYRSCLRLGRNRLDCVLLHRAEHLDSWNMAAWQSLQYLVEQRVVERVGVSIQSPDELSRVLREPLVTVIQLPFNILDTRWGSAIEILLRAKRDRRITVYVRSVFLQGLLLTDKPKLWVQANCSTPEKIMSWLHEQVEIFGRESVTDLCLAYVRSQKWIDGIVAGMETISQLRENVRLCSMPELTKTELDRIECIRPTLKEATLNPALWSTGR